MIQTVDFFTPIVNDPYAFGQIAAANALSDIYAMGGVPKTVMNLVAFSLKTMDISMLRQIIQGGLDKMTEAGMVLIGGLASSSVIESTIRLMATLNRSAAEIMSDFAVSACTDITDFGLLGQLAEMVAGLGFGMTIYAAMLPVIPEAREYAAMGLVSAGS